MSEMEKVMELDADITLDDIEVELEMQEIMQGSNDYLELINLPSINGVVLKGNIDETDPTVPQWAKEPNKPHYDASEVGAVAIVEGKGLSTNDYTDVDKQKVSKAITEHQDISGKADKSVTYTKANVDALLRDKANTNDVYNKSTVNTLLDAKANANNVYTKTEVDKKINDIPTVDAYTKAETNALLNSKANADNTYTKAEVDALLNDVSVDVITNSEITAIINKYF